MLAVTASCGLGNVHPLDYAPAGLSGHIHDSVAYVATYLMDAHGITLTLAHPRLGQPAIRRAGEPIDIMWITRAGTTSIEVSLDSGMNIGLGDGTCDDNGVCHLEVNAPLVAPGLYGVCVTGGGAQACSPNALAIVADYNDPATVIHVSDAHCGDGDIVGDSGLDQSTYTTQNVFAAIAALDPPPDFVVFTGDGADTGQPDQRGNFVTQLASLPVPAFVVSGNHDWDSDGIDGHLLDVGPELDMDAWYGGTHLVGIADGQDEDDGNHDTTISESSGPDGTQFAWLKTVLDNSPTIAFFHHPIYNALFATIGPESRDELKGLLTRDNMLAVLTGHTHATAVFDVDGNSRGLSLDSGNVPRERWPLHYVSSRVSKDTGGYALLHLGMSRVDYRWVALP